MAHDLVIVESPTKARTMQRLLGSSTVIKASMGHVRDLPTKNLGIDIENAFNPSYVTLRNKQKVIQEVRLASKGVRVIYLATDPDREGEAISWHLVEAAGLHKATIKRVVFHEITPEAVKEAFLHPRTLDLDLVNAQQARRILDRLMGYLLSPVLWKKIGGGLSAGRVQSVALRLLIDREREIRSFATTEYWTITSHFIKAKAKPAEAFTANLHSLSGEKKRLDLSSQADTEVILQDLENAEYTVTAIRQRRVNSRPNPPFTTSTLQQEAGRRLRFSVKKTMQVAQQLYEGIALDKDEPVGLITYMRTDSVAMASSAVAEAHSYIEKTFGAAYHPKTPRIYTTRTKAAQEAHEAIRPTSFAQSPDAIRPNLTSDQFKLYTLIWQRAIASQMSNAIYKSTAIDITATKTQSRQDYLFRSTGSELQFLGYRIVYTDHRDQDTDPTSDQALPSLDSGESLDCRELQAGQHFTKPPPRYTEASLVKAMEERGIGRPSTYAPTISTLQDRDYARREGSQLVPTQLGEVVIDLLVKHFAMIVDPDFTAQMETALDEVAQGTLDWTTLLADFYKPFNVLLSAAKDIPKVEIPTTELCDQCGRIMVIKSGRYGRFLSCSGYPECRSSRRYVTKVGVSCPRCEGDIVERRARKKGTIFYGCANFPTCNFLVSRRPLATPCPVCNGLLIVAGRNASRCTNCNYRGSAPQDEANEAHQVAETTK